MCLIAALSPCPARDTLCAQHNTICSTTYSRIQPVPALPLYSPANHAVLEISLKLSFRHDALVSSQVQASKGEQGTKPA